jgi:hypothetical protein
MVMTVPVTIDPRYYDAVIFHLDGAATDAARIDAAAWTQSADGVAVFESAIALDAGVRTAAYSTGHNCEKVLAASSIAGCSVLVLEDVSLLEASPRSFIRSSWCCGPRHRWPAIVARVPSWRCAFDSAAHV